MTNHPPIDTLRDGPIKAAIWENEGQNGPYYAVTFAKTFRDSEGRLADGTAFTGADLLRLAELSRQAYAKTNALRQQYSNDRDEPDLVESDRSETGREFDRRSRGNGNGSGQARRQSHRAPQ